VLIGINLTAYGTGDNADIADAVAAAAAIPEIERVRLGSLEPDMMSDEIIEKLSRVKKLCPQFHLSLQSGCDRTLKRMNRHYDTDFYRNIVKKLREKFEYCSITTDIMVGFAGESDEDFEQSVNFVREIGFAKVNVFPYSRRKGTKADSFTDHIDEKTKRRRTEIMLKAAEQTQLDFLESRRGATLPVLFESRNRNGFIEGYTPDYTLVCADAPDSICGRIIDVTLDKIENGGFKTVIHR
jgi:threonylcarbamoyladenosine tRNA methylthiotransferase MtaB